MSEKNSNEVLGLQRGIVCLRDYTPLWEELYQEEEKRIRAVIGHLIIDIQHIGSTAIPGIKAKPILDMMVGVARLGDALSCQAPLEAIGYDYIAHRLTKRSRFRKRSRANTFPSRGRIWERGVGKSLALPRSIEEGCRIGTEV